VLEHERRGRRCGRGRIDGREHGRLRRMMAELPELLNLTLIEVALQ
jgi:hypothetical protein